MNIEDQTESSTEPSQSMQLLSPYVQNVLSQAQEGNYAQQMLLVKWYYYGDTTHNILKNDHEAFTWGVKAAEHKKPDAYYALAVLHEEGIGTSKNLKTAIHYYELAAYQDFPKALAALGRIHEDHCIYGEASKKLAEQYYARGAEKGHAECQNNLALLYENNTFIHNNKELAHHWYTKAAQQGLPDGLYNLASQMKQGVHKENGEEDTTRYPKAFSYFLQAADAGHIDALYQTALCYYNGLGTTQDTPKALQYLEKAAQNKHIDACLLLRELQDQ